MKRLRESAVAGSRCEKLLNPPRSLLNEVNRIAIKLGGNAGSTRPIEDDRSPFFIGGKHARYSFNSGKSGTGKRKH